MSEITGQAMVIPSLIGIIAISVIVFLGVVVFLWRRGKTVESLLVWVSMWLFLITLILALK
jgi:hypothetical protein